MSKKFYAVNRETGERWKPSVIDMGFFCGEKKSFLMMYDTGFLAEVVDDGYNNYITPLDTKVWECVVKDNIKNCKTYHHHAGSAGESYQKRIVEFHFLNCPDEYLKAIYRFMRAIGQ